MSEPTYSIGPVVRDVNACRISLAVLREGEGEFSAIALNLPGAGSCGATEAAAIENAKEAVAALFESYFADGKRIPFCCDYEVPDGAKLVTVVVKCNRRVTVEEIPDPPAAG